MTKFAKLKRFISAVFNTLFTVVFLFTLLVTFKSSLATFNKKLPSVFGFSVSEIKSESMLKSGFEKGDYVVTRIVDPEQLKVGDIIVYYAHGGDSERRPMLPSDDRSDMMVVFHEIIEIYTDNVGKTYFITKGSSNASRDTHPVTAESICGIYVETNEILDIMFGMFLQGNAFLYWIIACLVLIVLKQFGLLYGAVVEMKIQRLVLKGKLNLLDKKCFEKAVFESFANNEKNKLIKEAPFGLAALYEFLLYGKITKRSNAELAEKLKKKRTVTVDMLCLTYANEPHSHIKSDLYTESLPKKNKDMDKYTNVEDYKQKSKVEKIGAWSAFFGCVIFTLLYYAAGYFTNYFNFSEWYEIYPIVIIPIFALLYLISTLSGCNEMEDKLLKQLAITPLLPDCYHFILRPYKFSAEKISEDIAEIERRQLAILDYQETMLLEGSISSLPEPIALDYSPEEIAMDDPDAEPEGFAAAAVNEEFLNRKNRDTADIAKRLEGTSYECLDRYSVLKNMLLSHKGVKSRLSTKYDTFRRGRIALVRMAVRGNTLRVYFNLDPRVLDARYYVRDVSDKKIFAEFPALLNVRSTRSFNYAVELINKIAEVYDLKKMLRYESYDYAKDFIPSENVYKSKEMAEELQPIVDSTVTNDVEYMAEEVAADVVIEEAKKEAELRANEPEVEKLVKKGELALIPTMSLVKVGDEDIVYDDNELKKERKAAKKAEKIAKKAAKKQAKIAAKLAKLEAKKAKKDAKRANKNARKQARLNEKLEKKLLKKARKGRKGKDTEYYEEYEEIVMIEGRKADLNGKVEETYANDVPIVGEEPEKDTIIIEPVSEGHSTIVTDHVATETSAAAKEEPQEVEKTAEKEEEKTHIEVDPDEIVTKEQDEAAAAVEAEVVETEEVEAEVVEEAKEADDNDDGDDNDAEDSDEGEDNEDDEKAKDASSFIKRENREFKSFADRLNDTSIECRDKYNLIKNELLSFNKVSARRSVRFDTFRMGRTTPLARITVRGDIIRLYLSLEPKALDAKYFIKDVSDKKMFEEFPSLLNVRSNRSLNYALELIRHLAYTNNLTKNHAYKPVDYVEMPNDVYGESDD